MSFSKFLLPALSAVASAAPTSFTHINTQTIPALNMELWWKIEGDMLHAAVSAPITTGWVGFGIAEGVIASMPGSDIAMMWMNSDGTGTIRDYYATGYTQPIEECDGEQDWTLTAATKTASSMMFEFKRKLAAGNPQHDRSIVNDGVHTRMLFAYNKDSTPPATGTFTPAYHGSMRTTYQTNLFKTDAQRVAEKDLPARLVAKGIGFATMELRAGSNGSPHAVAAQITEYHESQCADTRTVGQALAPHANGSKPYILGFEAVVDDGNEKHVHHFTVKAYTGSRCDSEVNGIHALLWGAVTSDAYLFDGGAFALDSYMGISIEFHYDNPDLLTGLTDDSHVKVYYTYSPPTGAKALAGITFGDVNVRTRDPVKAGMDSRYEYTCPSSCLQSNFASVDEITVIGAMPHTHALGTIIETSVVDSAGNVKQKVVNNYYSYDLQSYLPLSEPLKVSKTDTVKVKCWYKNGKNQDVPFGLGSDEEMCMFIAVYYPALNPTVPNFCGYLKELPQYFCGTYDGVKTGDSLTKDQQLLNGYGNQTCSASSTTTGSNVSAPTTAPALIPTPVPASGSSDATSLLITSTVAFTAMLTFL